jgi:hypothetical protein
MGGRSDKLGNCYEGRWVVKQFLALLKEEIKSVVLEAIGDDEQGVDLWIRKLDNTRECQQCKARNRSDASWSISTLKNRNVFKYIKNQLDNASDVTYYFVSAVPFINFRDLCFRAKNNNGNEELFYENQVANSPEMKKLFFDFTEAMRLDVSVKDDILHAMLYLRRINFICYQDDTEAKYDLLDTIQRFLIGDAESIYALLANFAEENDFLGKEITANILTNYLFKHGFMLRNLNRDERILPRILELNADFEECFSPIQDTFIPRNEVDKCITYIMEGKSIILHGEAGYGKSGCVLGAIRQLKEQNIPVLAIKLDRRIPKDTAQKYGESLGLSASPIHCLSALSNKHCVLILDQLDAIRWTSMHNRSAIDVCRELIREAKNINSDETISVSIVLVCRTFDFNNDSTIKSLFHKDNPHEDVWKEIKISQLDEETVRKFTAPYYVTFSTKLTQLLRIPNNLFIWSKLDSGHKSLNYASTVDLIRGLWKQLCEQCEKHEIAYTALNDLKLTLMDKITQKKEQSVPDILLQSFPPIAIDFAISQGLLLRTGNFIGFTHQSFYDYFLVEKMLVIYYENKCGVEDILGALEEQTPARRYQLQMFLQILLDTDAERFLKCGKTVLESPKIRLHMKFVFLELFGQVEFLTPSMRTLVDDYIANTEWSSHFLNTTVLGRPVFVKYLIESACIGSWLSDDRYTAALHLLKSTNNALQNEIVELLRPLAFQSETFDSEIFSTLCWKIEDDSDSMFAFRMELLNHYPNMWTHYYDMISLAKENAQRTVKLFAHCLTKTEKRADTHMSGLNETKLKEFDAMAVSNPCLIWETFMPLINEQTKNTTYYYDSALNGYRFSHYHDEEDLGRVLVRLLKVSTKKLIEENAPLFLEKCTSFLSSTSFVVNEILISSFELLPIEHSDFVLAWLMSDSPRHLFCRTGIYEEELYLAKQLIAKFSSFCSEDIFNKLESFIYYYHEEDESEYARYRFSVHKNAKTSDCKLYYWPYWGEVQTYLLPALDSVRVSEKSKQLIGVLSRRFSGYYCHHIQHRGHSGWVASSISGKTERFSDKRWIQIITNPKVKQAAIKHHWKEVPGGFLETAPRLFAQTFEGAAVNNPERYAKLALQLPNDTDPFYICAIYNLLGKSKNEKAESSEGQPIEFELVQKIIYKFGFGDTKPSVARAFCSIVRNRPNEDWNKDIINQIINIALNYDESKSEEPVHNIEGNAQNEEKNYERLNTKWFNSIRGVAVDALVNLLFSNENLYDIILPVAKQLAIDPIAAIETPVIELTAAIYNTDKDLAIKLMDNLITMDIRIAGHHYAFNMIIWSFLKSPEKYADVIMLLYLSSDEYLVKQGAAMLTNVYLLYDYHPFENILFDECSKTDAQLQGISRVAKQCLQDNKYREKGKRILEALLIYSGEWAHSYSQLFYNDLLHAEEDMRLIKEILIAKPHKVLHAFSEYVQKNGFDLSQYSDVLLRICENLTEVIEEDKKSGNYYGLMSELPALISQLFDCTIDNTVLNQKCLDMWDLLFEKQVGETRQLSQSIMEM